MDHFASVTQMGGDESACGTTRADEVPASVQHAGGYFRPGMFFRARCEAWICPEYRKRFIHSWWQSRGSADFVRAVSFVSAFAQA